MGALSKYHKNLFVVRVKRKKKCYKEILLETVRAFMTWQFADAMDKEKREKEEEKKFNRNKGFLGSAVHDYSSSMMTWLL